MTLVAFPLVIQGPSGSAISGGTATITHHVVGAATLGGGAPAIVYASETAASPIIGNQIVSDDNGRFTQGASSGYAQYWLPPGSYDITISGDSLTSPLTSYTVTRELASGRPARFQRTFTVGDQVAPGSNVCGSLFVEGNLTITDVIIHTASVGAIASTFQIETDTASRGSLAVVTGFGTLTPGELQQRVALETPLVLNDLDRVACVCTNTGTGTSQGWTIQLNGFSS